SCAAPASSASGIYTFSLHDALPILEMREIPIGDLPLYSYDFDSNYPPAARALKEAIAEVDAVLFVTPEYNRSIPGALKNAIDWADRKSTRLNSSHVKISYAVFCLKK